MIADSRRHHYLYINSAVIFLCFHIFNPYFYCNNMATITKNTTAEELVQIYNTDLNGKVAIVTGSNTG
jgi:hypothetical protein